MDQDHEEPLEDQGRQFLFLRHWTLNRRKRANGTMKPTMVTGSVIEIEDARVQEEMAARAAIMVDFPFENDLEHNAINLAQMFKATVAFDAHEVAAAKFGTGALTDLIGDVVSVGRTMRTLRITPSRALVMSRWLRSTMS
jgi:hypothetical protein